MSARRTSLSERLYRAGILKKAVTGPGSGGKKPDEQAFPVIIAKIISTGFGLGYAPFAQGTFGALLVPVAAMFVPASLRMNFNSASWTVLSLAFVTYAVGVWAAGVCERIWGHDPGRVVVDEIAGTLVAVAFLPLSVANLWLGFLLFRVFDIFKPWPVRQFERFSGGWGVMNDDIVAGVLANIVLRLILLVL